MDNETTLEAILLNQNQKADETINALETIIAQNENNKVDDILEAQLLAMDSIDKKIENNKLEIEVDGAEVISIKGDKGEKGDKGDKGDTGANGKDGKDGKDGRDGKDGKDGINGVDGISANVEEITKDVLEAIVPQIPTVDEIISLIPIPKDGRDGKDGKNGKNGKDVDPKKIKELEDSLQKVHSIASKTVSLAELDDVNLSGLTQTNGKYNLGSGGGVVDSVNGQTGVVVLTKTDISLGNVDNTSDANKPVSTATQTALDGKVDENAAITGATKTKITYDAKGLVTAGADATTADIADSTNARYVTDAQLTVIGNTSGTNTGDNATNSQYSGLASSKQDVITGLTASGAELNILDGATLTTTELNYVDGVTSSIQTQLDSKAPTASPTFTGTVTLPTGLTGPVRTDAGVVSAIQEGDQFTRVAQALGSTIKFNTLGAMTLNSGVNLTDNLAVFAAVYIDRAETITGVKWFQSVAGDYTADQTNHVALYSYSGGTLTQVAASANDGNMWKATANTLASKAFSTPYSATPGVYFVAAVYNASAIVTNPQIVGSVTVSNAAFYSLDLTNGAKLHSTLSATNSLPASTAASSLAASSATRWFGLY